MSQPIDFVEYRKNEAGEYIKVDELIWRMEAEEMAILYSAQCVRFRHLTPAEKNLKNYYHPEGLRIGGKTKIVEIHTAVPVLEMPFLTKMVHKTDTKAASEELAKLLPNSASWASKRDVGIQTIASIGWLMDVTKARPPDITKDTSNVEYAVDILPQNLDVKEESKPTGYNDGQIALLEEARGVATDVLKYCGNKHKEIGEMNIVIFAQRVFKTYSKTFNALPDPSEEERKRDEAMREQAKKNAEDDD
jgi:hypothetical protein